jgi:hypothetical protein
MTRSFAANATGLAPIDPDIALTLTFSRQFFSCIHSVAARVVGDITVCHFPKGFEVYLGPQ